MFNSLSVCEDTATNH